MLTDAFLTLLDNAKPGRCVTGIVCWDVQVPQKGAEALARVASIKAPVLEAAKACAGARVNPLEGTCQAILDVPVEGWRQLLESRRTLFVGANLRVEANEPAFSTLPEPL